MNRSIRMLWKMSLVAALLVLAGAVAEADVFTFQEGDANGYSGTKNTFMFDYASAPLYGNTEWFKVEHQVPGDSGEGIQRGLIDFPGVFGSGSNQVPTSKIVLGVSLGLHTGGSTYAGTANTVSVHQMLRPWDEATANWTTPGAGPAWGSAGMQADVDYDSVALDGFTIPSADAWYSWGVTQSVLSMQQGSPNNGWAVLCGGPDQGQFWSDDAVSAAEYRPRLTLETAADAIGVGTVRLFKQGSAFGQTDATLILDRASDHATLDTNYGADVRLLVEQQTTAGNDHEGIVHSLVRFPDALGTNPSQVQPGETVVSARLALRAADGTAGPLSVHRVLQPWHEDQATYNDRLVGTPWDVAGMQAGTDYEALGFTQTYTATTGEWTEFDITATAQAWLDGAANQGVVIRSTSSDGANFSSDDDDSWNAPVLIMETVTPAFGTVVRPATPGSTFMATYIRGNGGQQNNNFGSNVRIITENDPAAGEVDRGLIAVSDLIGSGENQVREGAQVLSAVLRLHIPNDIAAWAGSADTHYLYQVLSPWDENAVTWSNFNDGGVAGVDYLTTPVASLVPNILDGFYYIDVTESVQNWADGQENFGWMLINPGADMCYWDSDDYMGGQAYRPLLLVEWVPEPTALVLLISGLAMLFFRRRRRR